MTARATAGGAAPRRKTVPGRKVLVDHVVNEVMQAIFPGDFPVGSELSAPENLAARFGFSMTVIR